MMKKVLIVDDEPLILTAISKTLPQVCPREFFILTATNGKQAAEIIESENVSLVVTDLNMPIMDGFELMAWMMSYYPQIPVIVLTASRRSDVQERLQQLGAISCLEKPVDISVIAAQIRQALATNDSRRNTGNLLLSFLHLLSSEKKTCSLRTASKGKSGALSFACGELISARVGEVEGEEVISQMLDWEDAAIEIAEFDSSIQRTIHKSLPRLLSEIAPKFAVAATSSGSGFSGSLPIESLNTAAGKFNLLRAQQTLNDLHTLEGIVGAALFDSQNARVLASTRREVDFENALKNTIELYQVTLETRQSLKVSDPLQDVLISFNQQYHLLRPLACAPDLFIYVILKKGESNLGRVGQKLVEIEALFQI